MSPIDVADALFRAFETGDDASVHLLCAPEFFAIQNGGEPMDLPTVLAFSKAVQSVVSEFRYENRIRSETATGFVEEHDVRGTLPNGVSVKLTICVVAEMVDGKIKTLREYFDTAAAAKIIACLSAG